MKIDHFLRNAKAYVATIGAAATAAATFLPTPESVYAAAGAVIATAIGTFQVPNKGGVTLAEAVATDGAVFEEAAKQLGALKLPGYTEAELLAKPVLDKVPTLAGDAAKVAEAAAAADPSLAPEAAAVEEGAKVAESIVASAPPLPPSAPIG